MEEKTYNCVPPTRFTRNEFGLLDNIDYVFSQDGKVDWRKMVKPEYLVPNTARTKETDVSKLKDNELLILLGGLKELAKLRGYTKATPVVRMANLDAVCVEYVVTWMPNYETENKEVISGGVSMATISNTEGFTQTYLAEMAENRALARCIRSFLGINIVSKEEVGKNSSDTPQESFAATSPHELLRQTLNEKNVTFEQLKKQLIDDKVEGAKDFNGIGDLKPILIFDIIDKLANSKKKK
jgi:hypothetical protein